MSAPTGVSPELIICAAIQMPDGYVIRGHRHNDALGVAAGMPRYAESKGVGVVQGFVTSRNRFVGRQEASLIHRGTDADLYSEDLY